FWQEEGSSDWKYTNLTGNNKLKMFREFDLSQIFPEDQAIMIRQLWNNFVELYESLKNPQITGIQFKQKAIEWLKLFLTKSTGSFNSTTFIKGLYHPNDITPYIHVM
ncbi:42505_t:CDS:1, partial [Gigaspora margarita]